VDFNHAAAISDVNLQMVHAAHNW